MGMETQRVGEPTATMPSAKEIFEKFDSGFRNGSYMNHEQTFMLNAFIHKIAGKNMSGPELFRAWDDSLAMTCDLFERTNPPSSAVINIAHGGPGENIGFRRVIDSLGLPAGVAERAKTAAEKAVLMYRAVQAARSAETAQKH
jgi:hypothetical protein